MNDQGPVAQARIADPIAQARTAVESILTALGVARVVYVDDANDGAVSLEEFIIAAISLDEKELIGVLPEIGEVIPEDQDVLRQKLRDVWGKLDANTQAKRAKAVLVAARRNDSNEADDVADASILSELIPRERLVSVSPLQWEAQKERLLRDSKDQRTLFLFDRDFSEAGGDSDGGIKIIASLLARNDTESLICGLLTHTVTPETQTQQWGELSSKYGIPKDRFVVIPKLHLSKAPIIFAQTLKFATLSPDFAELKRKTKEIIAEAASVAASRVEKVSIYDLDHIVFRVSADEGLWEPDMLFRLHALFHRLESLRLAHEGGTLETIASKLRAVSNIPRSSEVFAPPSSAWDLQREELYESESHINNNHLPLEVGDIFERVHANSTKRYILLAQPCDLMVRSDGKRYPEIDRFALAEVASAKEAPRHSEEMPYFGASPTERWYVKLKLVHFVSMCILDLCVLNQDGVARLILESDAPSGIRPAWRARHTYISRLINQTVSKADLLRPKANESPTEKQVKQKLAKDLEGLFFDDGLFKGKLIETNGTRMVMYDCKRIMRLSRARAIGLLMSYTASLNRPAYDRDFGVVDGVQN